MRILHVVSNLSIRSGIMSLLMSYFRNINREHIQFDFLYFDEREIDYKEEIKKLGGSIHKISTPLHLYRFKKELEEFLKQNTNKYKIIHIHEIFLPYFFRNAKKYGVKKLIIHSHAINYSDKKLNSLRNWLFSLPNDNIADHFCACSQIAGVKILRKKFKEEGTIIQNAIDLNKFYPNEISRNKLRKELKIEDKFVIGHVGSFVKAKNHFFLINILREIVKIQRNTILILIGEGILKEKVKEKLKKYNLENNVLFLNLGTKNNVNEILRVLDCFVFPSISEGLGIALIEAQASGLPCIFSDKIPKEANILSDSNKIISLNARVETWAREILNYKEVNVEKIKIKIQKAGFDISLEARKLEEYYFRIL